MLSRHIVLFFREDESTKTKLVDYVMESIAFNFSGGVPTSIVRSKQQWDFSNAWAPLQELLVTGLKHLNEEKTNKIAYDLVEKWTRNVYVSYVQSGNKMFEKYDVEQVCLSKSF